MISYYLLSRFITADPPFAVISSTAVLMIAFMTSSASLYSLALITILYLGHPTHVILTSALPAALRPYRRAFLTRSIPFGADELTSNILFICTVGGVTFSFATSVNMSTHYPKKSSLKSSGLDIADSKALYKVPYSSTNLLPKILYASSTAIDIRLATISTSFSAFFSFFHC